MRDDEHDPRSRDPNHRVRQGLVVSLVVGAVIFLALVMWLLRTSGSIWG